MTLRLAVLAGIILLSTAPARSEVLDSAANGFTVRTTLTMAATPDVVYRSIIHNVGDWWNSEHTFSGNAHNLSIEEKVPGCFCEKLPNNGMVRHMEVAQLLPGKAITLSGALGPLGTLAATGTMQIQLTADGSATNLVVTYAVGGYMPKGIDIWAAPVDDVIKDQFTRVKAFVETSGH